MSRERPLAIAFIHPDLGLGGAERLVVDAALELSGRGHAVCTCSACPSLPCTVLHQLEVLQDPSLLVLCCTSLRSCMLFDIV